MQTIEKKIRDSALGEFDDLHVGLASLYTTRDLPHSEMARSILNILPRLDGDFTDKSNLLFFLHAAVLLAQSGEFAGVDWLLRCFRLVDKEHSLLISKALRDCNRFPFAAIAGNLFDDPSGLAEKPGVAQLLARSDEDLWQLGSESDKLQESMLELIRSDYLGSRSYRENWMLDLGVVLKCPFINDSGFRWTGFLALEGQALALPFGLEHVINADDENATQQLSRVLGTEGRRVLVAWQKSESPSAAFVYALPFGCMPKDQVKARVAEQSYSGLGVEVGILVDWIKRDERYKVIASYGFSTASRYAPARQRIGDCFFYHPENSGRLLSSAYNLSKPEQANFLSQMLRRCQDRLGVVIRNFQNQDGGEMVCIVHASSQEEQVRPVDHRVMPGALAIWEYNDEIARWFTTLLDDFQIESSCAHCYATGRRLCTKCNGNNWATCYACNGSGHENCGHCNGEGWRTIACSCGDGKFRPTCKKCSGTGRCQTCGGSGTYADSGRTCVKCGGDAACDWCNGRGHSIHDCKFCEGTGEKSIPCKTCKQTGNWNCSTCHGKKMSTCDRCEGKRIINCSCGRKGVWKIRAR